MTTIVAIQSAEGVEFVADGQATAGNKVYSAEKVFRVGSVTVGASGHLRVANLIRYADLPQPDVRLRMRGDVAEWLVNTFIPALAERLSSRGSLWVEDGVASTNSGLLVAVTGQCFQIDADFCLGSDPAGRCSVGSGSNFAIGALEAGATAEEAVRVAVKHDAYSGGKLQRVFVGKGK